MATVKEFVRKGLPPQTHAYDDPDLSPVEFLQAVYRATHLPMSIRIDAARGALPFTEPRPASSPPPRCKIVIPPFDYEPRTSDHGSVTHPPEQINSDRQSNRPGRSQSDPVQSEGVPPVYIDENPEPSNLPDYSSPPTPDELQAIKSAIANLRPDLAHLPVPDPHLCSCGHWIFGLCPLGERCRDTPGTKLN